MSQASVVKCPYCNSRFEADTLPDGFAPRGGKDRLKGTELECAACGNDFEFFFY